MLMQARVAVAAGVLWMTGLSGCSDGGPAEPEPKDNPEPPALISQAVPAGFPAGTISERAPRDNELTEARAQLGKRLFFDPRLSRSGDVSCGKCHEQRYAFAQPDRVSTGVDLRQGTRNAPPLVNLAWGESFFWDGRALSLEEQAGKPIENPDEMGLSLPEAVARVADDESYVAAFLAAYQGPPSEESLRKAIASFVRTLVSANSPYDRHLRGDDADFGEPERRGEAIFLSDAGGCFHCHPAGMLTNEGFFNNGSYDGFGDSGRHMLSGRSGDLGKFKVPGLRNIEYTAPYMHDGSVPTLEAVIEHYDRGGRGHETTDPQIEPLLLSPQEKADLLAFLRSLSDADFLVDPRYGG
jgi:cytochrome c peroxidase